MERSRELYLESPTEVNLLTHLFATSDLLTSNGVSHKLYEQSIEILPSSNTALNRFSRKAHRLSQVTVSYSPLRIRESGAHAMFAFDVAPDKSQIPLELLISADFILINRVSDADAHEWVHLLQLNYSSKRRSQGNIFNADFRTVRELFAFDEIRAYFTSASVILNDFKRGFLTNMMKEEFGSILKSLTIYLNAYQGGGAHLGSLHLPPDPSHWTRTHPQHLESKDGDFKIAISPFEGGSIALVTVLIYKENTETSIPLKNPLTIDLKTFDHHSAEGTAFLKTVSSQLQSQLRDMETVTANLSELVARTQQTPEGNLLPFYENFVRDYRGILKPHL